MKASHIALETMRGHLDAVYDITVAYEGTLKTAGQRKPAPSMPGKQTCLGISMKQEEDWDIWPSMTSSVQTHWIF